MTTRYSCSWRVPDHPEQRSAQLRLPGPEEQDERARRINEAYLYVWRLRFRGVSYNSHHSPPTDPADIQGLAARLDYVRLYEKAEGVRLLPDDI